MQGLRFDRHHRGHCVAAIAEADYDNHAGGPAAMPHAKSTNDCSQTLAARHMSGLSQGP